VSIVAATLLGGTVALAGSAAFADTGGTVTGHVTDGGAPVASAQVVLYDLDENRVVDTTTDESGAYSITAESPGDYKLAFTLPGYVQQWAHGKSTFETADVFTLAGGDVTVDESVAPHGSIAGHVTRSDGTPLANPYILAYSADTRDLVAQINGDANGAYRLPYVPAGRYKLSFRGPSLSDPEQYAHQQLSYDTAQVFGVAVGQDITVDEHRRRADAPDRPYHRSPHRGWSTGRGRLHPRG